MDGPRAFAFDPFESPISSTRDARQNTGDANHYSRTTNHCIKDATQPKPSLATDLSTPKMNGHSRRNNPELVTSTTESNASKISTTTGTGIKELTISVESFNCHGYKQSFGYILSIPILCVYVKHGLNLLSCL